MLTQKAITSALPAENDLSKDLVKWVASNSALLQEKFEKKYPRSRNKFNVQLKNRDGRNRTIVVTSTGDVKVDRTGGYKNVLTWQNVRRIGAPAN
jgi:hypothetical protein